MKLFSVYTVTLAVTIICIIIYFTKISEWKPKFVINTNQMTNLSVLGLKEILRCYDKPLKFSIRERKDFWVFNNFVRAQKTHRCHESITYTVHGDFLHIDNLNEIVERWNGPVSVALHAAGSDFHLTLDSIAYLRNCKSALFKELVTFHIVMDYDHFPEPTRRDGTITPLAQIYNDQFNCSKEPPYKGFQRENMYKTKKKLMYPINLMRNVARESAQTHFVLAADIELYPSSNVIKTFLSMVVDQKHLFTPESRNVFVLPIFEVEKNHNTPGDKRTLLEMYKNKTAVMFHSRICAVCHMVPKFEEWLKLPVNDKLNVFTPGKREKKFRNWEPFYISTNDEPFFEERIFWENGGDKMTQNYKQCLLNYNYWILDNAFVVHSPGIKVYNRAHPDVRNQNTPYSKNRLNYEYEQLFGERKTCN